MNADPGPPSRLACAADGTKAVTVAVVQAGGAGGDLEETMASKGGFGGTEQCRGGELQRHLKVPNVPLLFVVLFICLFTPYGKNTENIERMTH